MSTISSPVFSLKPSSAGITAISGLAAGSSTLGSVGTILACIVGIGMVTLPHVFARAGWIGGLLILLGLPVFLTVMAIAFYRAIEKLPTSDGRPQPCFPDVMHAALGGKARLITALVLYGEYTLFLSLLMLTLTDELGKYWTGADRNVVLLVVACGLLPCEFVRSPSVASKLSVVGMVGVVMLCGTLLVAAVDQLQQDGPQTKHDLIRFNAFELGVSIANVLLVFAASGLIPTIVHDMKQPDSFPKVAKFVFSIGAGIYIIVGILAYAAWGNVFLDTDTSVLMKISEMDSTKKIMLTISLGLVCLPQFSITAMVVNQGVDLLVGSDATYKQLGGRILLHGLQAAIVSCFKSIIDLLGVISSFTTVILVVILPATLSWKIRGTRNFSLAAIIFGLVVMAFGSTSAIGSYIDSMRKTL